MKLRLPFKQHRFGFFAGYKTFEEALAQSTPQTSSRIALTRAGTVELARRLDQEPILSLSARDQQLATGFLILKNLACACQHLSVLDFGGALGAHFLILRRLLPAVELDWHVLEVPSVAQAGRDLYASELLGSAPTFHESTASLAATYDIGVASGSLQYTPAPREAFAAFTLRCRLGAIVNRFPSDDFGNDFVTLQRVHPSLFDAAMPAWFFDRDTWERLFRQEFEIGFRWEVPQDVVSIRGMEHSMQYCGYLLVRRESAASIDQ